MGIKDRAKEWYRLDNAAKGVPFSMIGADTRVFRLVCELKEEVDPQILQTALDRTLEEFPYMNCCMRKGIFWYYMDEMEEGAKVVPEHKAPHALQALYIPGRRSLLYRINYYRSRINLEMFHTLADGTGGFMFFQRIVTEYLMLKYRIELPGEKRDRSAMVEKHADSFSQYYESDKAEKWNFMKEMFPVKAYQVRGDVDENLEEHLMEGTVSLQKMKEIAKGFGVTLGVLSASLWVEAIVKQMRRAEYKQPIVVNVPVNLRQYFPSVTARNFFGVITVSFDARRYDGTLESVLKEIGREFKEQLTAEKIQENMNSYSALEHNLALKYLPLVFKNMTMAGVMRRINRGVTTSVSNVGKVEISKELIPYIEKFCSFMACTTVFLCISTFQDNMVYGITSCFEKHPVALHFFRRIRQLGAEVEIATNDYDDYTRLDQRLKEREEKRRREKEEKRQLGKQEKEEKKRKKRESESSSDISDQREAERNANPQEKEGENHAEV